MKDENKSYARRFRYVRKIGNSYYAKLEPADIKDYNITATELQKKRILIEISDIIKLFKKSK